MEAVRFEREAAQRDWPVDPAPLRCFVQQWADEVSRIHQETQLRTLIHDAHGEWKMAARQVILTDADRNPVQLFNPAVVVGYRQAKMLYVPKRDALRTICHASGANWT